MGLQPPLLAPERFGRLARLLRPDGNKACSNCRDGINAAPLIVALGAGDTSEMPAAADGGGTPAPRATGTGSKLLCGEWAWSASENALVPLARIN